MQELKGYFGEALHAAGVKFAIAGGSGALYTNRLPWDAGVAVAFGLPEEEALEAVQLPSDVPPRIGLILRIRSDQEMRSVFSQTEGLRSDRRVPP